MFALSFLLKEVLSQLLDSAVLLGSGVAMVGTGIVMIIVLFLLELRV